MNQSKVLSRKLRNPTKNQRQIRKKRKMLSFQKSLKVRKRKTLQWQITSKKK